MAEPTTFGPETARKLYEISQRAETTTPVSKILREQPFDQHLQNIKVGKTDSTLSASSSGTVSVWRKNTSTGVLEDTGDNLTVWLDVATNDQDISADKWVIISRFRDENLWRVIGAECEDEAAPEIFQAINSNQAQTLTTTFYDVRGMAVSYTSGTGLVLPEITLIDDASDTLVDDSANTLFTLV